LALRSEEEKKNQKQQFSEV